MRVSGFTIPNKGITYTVFCKKTYIVFATSSDSVCICNMCLEYINFRYACRKKIVV